MSETTLSDEDFETIRAMVRKEIEGVAARGSWRKLIPGPQPDDDAEQVAAYRSRYYAWRDDRRIRMCMDVGK